MPGTHPFTPMQLLELRSEMEQDLRDCCVPQTRNRCMEHSPTTKPGARSRIHIPPHRTTQS
jgi:hypothetical protein